MILLSITGLFRTILIILGVLFLMSLLGKMAQARRNIADEKRMKKEDDASRKMVEKAKKNYGKTSITADNSSNVSDSEFTDYEEVD